MAGTAAEEYSPASLPRAAAGEEYSPASLPRAAAGRLPGRLRTERVTGALVEGADLASRTPLQAEESMAAYKGGLPNARMGLRNQAELAQSYERK